MPAVLACHHRCGPSRCRRSVSPGTSLLESFGKSGESGFDRWGRRRGRRTPPSLVYHQLDPLPFQSPGGPPQLPGDPCQVWSRADKPRAGAEVFPFSRASTRLIGQKAVFVFMSLLWLDVWGISLCMRTTRPLSPTRRRVSAVAFMGIQSL